MKTLFFFILFNIISVEIYSQSDPIQRAEILIWNYTSHPVTINVFPIGAAFSGHNDPPNNFVKNYSLHRSNPDPLHPPYWPNPNYITGGIKTINSNKYVVIDFRRCWS